MTSLVWRFDELLLIHLLLMHLSCSLLCFFTRVFSMTLLSDVCCFFNNICWFANVLKFSWYLSGSLWILNHPNTPYFSTWSKSEWNLFLWLVVPTSSNWSYIIYTTNYIKTVFFFTTFAFFISGISFYFLASRTCFR